MASSRWGRYGGGGGGGAARIRACWKGTYASDYMGLIGLVVAIVLVEIAIPPFRRFFSLQDLRISFPYAEVERVPLVHLLFYAFVLPLVLLVAYNLVTGASRHKHHVTLLGLLVALAEAGPAGAVPTLRRGPPRHRRRPGRRAGGAGAVAGASNGLVSMAVCTQPNAFVLHDGWRSFPSGHTSFAFAGLGYLSLFLAGQLRVLQRVRASSSSRAGGILGVDPLDLDDDGDAPSRHAAALPLALACGVPLLGAALIAISRVQDYRHDVWDVCAGAALGWAVGHWSYRRYWPRLGSARCAEPYPAPLWAPSGAASPGRRGGASGGGGGDGTVGGGGGGYVRVNVSGGAGGGGGRDEEEGLGLGRHVWS
ncbi:hypothetical protein VTJ83DRAFT_7062 [Remersonia thermophila]|uniref:Phosphatidic acid phosphatase type 2/haloperoxidase domain-containing protein n=1 Tax=Remersonia thermophila TaxID=72144 RepID=A0ABR4D2M9_9PEZI